MNEKTEKMYHEDGGDEAGGRGRSDEVHRVLNDNPELLSPIPCASPSEEPQVDEVLSNEREGS